jgi:chromosome segregation ATPase
MSTATLERFPKTVSACHVEIIRLRTSLADVDEAKGDARELRRELDKAIGEIEVLQAKNSELDDRIDELEGEAEDRKDHVIAINRFLDEVERPVGRFVFDVVHGTPADRAILGLFDAAGRQP